jgi:hypothetical protein
MANYEPEGGTTRDDLVQRIALMEEMIAEGRQSTIRFGWSFVLWGLITLSGIGWQYFQPHSYWVWPVAIAVGFVIQFTGIVMRRRSGRSIRNNMQSRSIAAVWRMTAVAIVLYVGPAAVQHDTFLFAYIPALFMFFGLAHAISAVILRWRVQGVVAGLWWAGGVAVCNCDPAGRYMFTIYVAEIVLCMIFFGLYAMWLERRRAAAEGQTNA